MVSLKSTQEIAAMREAGKVVAAALAAAVEVARPGASLADLDSVAAEVIRDAGATPSFLGYRPAFTPGPFTGVLCLSVNDVVVHGIPDGTRLRDGDVVTIDGGARVDGYHGDAAVTIAVGTPDPAAIRLIDATRRALDAAIAVMVPGGRLGDIGHAIEEVARTAGYGILRDHGGHGIGTALHEDPHVPNTGRRGRGMVFRPGLVLAIEPMFHEGGGGGYRHLPDGWGVATADGTRAAHFEHTVAVTEDGPVVLTAP